MHLPFVLVGLGILVVLDRLVGHQFLIVLYLPLIHLVLGHHELLVVLGVRYHPVLL